MSIDPRTARASHANGTHHTDPVDHSSPQRDSIANALILLLKNIDPKLDVTHFAKHTPLKAGMKNSHDATTFITDCSREFGVDLTSLEVREEAQWALAGSAASMHGHHTLGNGSAFAFADFILQRMEIEGKTYPGSSYQQLQERQGVQI